MPRLLQRIRSWFGHKPEPDVRRNLILFDVSQPHDLADQANRYVSKLLYEAAVARGLSASHVSVSRYIYDQAVKAGRFVNRDPAMSDPGFAEFVLRGDLMWLVRNRNWLMKGALAAGGDAEYVFLDFEGEPVDMILQMDHSRNRRIVQVSHVPHEETNQGSYTIVHHGKEHYSFRMPDDAWDANTVIPILDHIVKVCADKVQR